MSPVLSSTARTFGIPRRHVRQSTATLFPVSPYATSPKPRAGDSPGGIHNVNSKVEAAAVDGSGGSTSGYTTADCPPPTSREAVPQGFESQADHRTQESAVPLVGIARLAACSPRAESHRKSAERPEYFLLPVKSILNKCDSTRVPFDWTINPYRGCEFGCVYCYARYTHEYMELDGGEFERKIFVKKDAGPLLAYDVAHKYSYASEGSGGEKPEHIAIGTATDPYQPAEREYGVTRACLEELAKREGLSISVITKSNQIVRDIDIFKKIAERSELSLNITITTLRARLARLLEPRAPRPDLRVAAVRQLREAGLRVGVSASPLIPGITDREGELEAVAEAVHEAGAQWFFSGVLFLMPSSAKQFLPFVREKFPRLTKQYEEWYAKEAYAPEKYRKMIADRVARLKQKYGFDSRPQRNSQRTTPCAQMKLGWESATSSAAL
ncbi:MAG TPA: radical SAM protein [Candidatus Binatus sp.]|jgi:DNA repair photolyase|nr:radical SAM protein [Candidatus Binatus sp.]